MPTQGSRYSLGLVAAITLCSPALADNWGHWRGPTGNGTSETAKPPVQFGSKANVRWRTEVPGRGSSSPVVWDDSVYVTSAVDVPGKSNELSFQVFCFDRNNGKQRWSRTAVNAAPHEGTHQTNGFASASPCTDGEFVYASFGSRGVYCYSKAGELVWNRDLGDMKIRNNFGEGSSPTLAGDLLIVPWDHEGPSALYALNKKTGDIVWQTPREEPTCWATPLIASDANGKKQVIMNGQNAARGYDLQTGKELWRCAGQTERPCASAVSADGVAYVASGFRGAFIGAFALTGTGDLSKTKNVLWTLKQDTPDVASPLLSHGRIYYFKGKTGLLTCVDTKSGKVYYGAGRIAELNATYASPIAAGGHIYLTDRDGTIVVIEDSDTLKVVATNKMDEPVDATPAAVDDELFVRGEKHLFCLKSASNK